MCVCLSVRGMAINSLHIRLSHSPFAGKFTIFDFFLQRIYVSYNLYDILKHTRKGCVELSRDLRLCKCAKG